VEDPAQRRASLKRPARIRLPRKAIASLTAVALIVGWLLHTLPFEVVAVYAILSGIAFLMYAFDKSAAEHGRRRVPENTLHAVALFGGWPGALLAQEVCRHKTRKAEFQVVFWLTVATHCAVLAWLLRAQVLTG
jgi:uncharacterized membrane protein YsdA (DUF1294 family)